MDTNHDGIISRDEWRARGGDAAGFDVVDTDHDGKISAAEWAVAEKAPVAREQSQVQRTW